MEQSQDGSWIFRWRYILVPFVCGMAIILLILALSLSLQVDIVPADIKTLNISGGPGIGDYDVFFALVDANNVNGPADGYAYFKIYDATSALIYNSEFKIDTNNYAIYSNYTSGPPLVGYHWVIPIENVTAGIPSGTGMGRADFLFLPLSGGFVEGTMEIPIPIASD